MASQVRERTDGPATVSTFYFARSQLTEFKFLRKLQRAWLVNKVRTDIAMRATKLNAQVQLTNLGKYILFCKIIVNLIQIPDDCSSS